MTTLPTMHMSQPIAAARKTLLGRRAKVARLRSHNETDGQSLRENEKDWVELASNEEIADVLLRLSERERREVIEIDAALARIDSGLWGRCEGCSLKFARGRLAAMPEARLCLPCAS